MDNIMMQPELGKHLIGRCPNCLADHYSENRYDHPRLRPCRACACYICVNCIDAHAAFRCAECGDVFCDAHRHVSGKRLLCDACYIPELEKRAASHRAALESIAGMKIDDLPPVVARSRFPEAGLVAAIRALAKMELQAHT